METGNLEKSLDYYTRGLNMAKKNGFDELINLFINNIGLIYLKQEHFEKALEHFRESASLNEKGYNHAIAINNIGIVKQQQGKLNEAVSYYEQSLKACQQINDEYCALTPLNSLAGLYLKQLDFDKSLQSSEKVIKTQEKLGLEKDLLISYNRMGLIYNQKQDYDLAIYYYNKSLAIAQHLNSGLIPYIYANLSDTYANNGQFEEALDTIQFDSMKCATVFIRLIISCGRMNY